MVVCLYVFRVHPTLCPMAAVIGFGLFVSLNWIFLEKNKYLLTKEVQQGRTAQKGPSWPRGSNLGDSTWHWITAETSGLRYWIKKYFHCGTKTLPVRQPAILTKPVFILFAIFNRQQYNTKTNKQPKPFQTFNHKWSYSLSMLLFHQGFLHFFSWWLF